MKSPVQEVEIADPIEAIVIPHGYRTTLPGGTRLRILQTLGDSATVTVLYNCLVVAAIAGTIEVGLTDDGQSDSDTIEILVDFQ